MYTMLIVAGVLVVVDYGMGTLAALYKGEFKSSKMREGLIHKLTYVVVIGLSFLLEWLEPQVGINIPLVLPALVYVTICELGSILENLVILNPDLANYKVLSLFKTAMEDKK